MKGPGAVPFRLSRVTEGIEVTRDKRGPIGYIDF